MVLPKSPSLRLSESKGLTRIGKGMFTSLVSGKGQNRDGKRKFKGQNCDGSSRALLGEPTPRAARSPPSAPPVNTFQKVHWTRATCTSTWSASQMVSPLVCCSHATPARTHASSRLSCPGAADVSASLWEGPCDRERKKLVAGQQAQKKELVLKHLNALKTFDEVRDSFVAVTPAG